MNLADSERMAGVLESVGYECAEDPSAADVLIYNTCSIREKAEVKVYSALGRQVRAHTGTAAASLQATHATAAFACYIAAPDMPLFWLPPSHTLLQAKRKRDRMGEMKIVVAGCVAQQEGEQLLRRVPEVDLVMGEQTASSSSSSMRETAHPGTPRQSLLAQSTAHLSTQQTAAVCSLVLAALSVGWVCAVGVVAPGWCWSTMRAVMGDACRRRASFPNHSS